MIAIHELQNLVPGASSTELSPFDLSLRLPVPSNRSRKAVRFTGSETISTEQPALDFPLLPPGFTSDVPQIRRNSVGSGLNTTDPKHTNDFRRKGCNQLQPCCNYQGKLNLALLVGKI